MKLGATISSERGKAVIKTGNEYLKVTILDSTENEVMELKFVTIKDNVILKNIWVGDMNAGSLEKYIKENGNLKHGTVCNFGSCQNTAYKYGVCKKHQSVEQ